MKEKNTSLITGIAFTAVAGTGKATVINELTYLRPDLFETVGSITTRPPKSEAHGKKYQYVNHEEFEAMLVEGKIFEFNKYSANNDQGFNYYATSIDSYEDIVRRNKVALFDLDINGLVKLKERFGPAVLSLFLDCERHENERRLLVRGTESAEEIKTRLETGDEELQQVPVLVKKLIIDERIHYGIGAQAGITANYILNLYLKLSKN